MKETLLVLIHQNLFSSYNSFFLWENSFCVLIQDDRIVSSPQHWIWEGECCNVGGSEKDPLTFLLQFAEKVRYWVETHWLFKCAQKYLQRGRKQIIAWRQKQFQNAMPLRLKENNSGPTAHPPWECLVS